MNNKYLNLKNLSNNSFGNDIKKSSAELIGKNNIKYYGVNIKIGLSSVFASAIANAICNAVSEGCVEFLALSVYTENIHHDDFIIDKDTLNLLKEFKIKNFTLYNKDGTAKTISI